MDYTDPNYEDTMNRKGEALRVAHKRCKEVLDKYLPLLHIDGGWPYQWDFNLIHDLEYRIEGRIYAHNRAVRDYLWYRDQFLVIDC